MQLRPKDFLEVLINGITLVFFYFPRDYPVITQLSQTSKKMSLSTVIFKVDAQPYLLLITLALEN